MGRERAVFIAATCALSVSMVLEACSRETTADHEPTVQEKNMKLVFWHYYNDAQKKYLGQLIQGYNDAERAERHVTVETYSQSSVGGSTNKIDLVLNGSTSDVEMANMSLAYRDMVVGVVHNNNEKLVDAGGYLTEDELAQYNQTYLEGGYIGNRFYILPLARSTELLLISQARLNEFLEADPRYSVPGMADWNSLEEMAEGYCKRIDDMTPDQEGDGNPFIGLDNLANYFVTTNHAMGSDIYHYDQGGKLIIDLKGEYVKHLFLSYYIPFTEGYCGASGKYRSDDLRQSVLTGYIGSSSSVLYFPDEVMGANEDMVPIEAEVYRYPMLSGCRETAIRQGAGVVISNWSGEENRASMDFIRWLTVGKGLELASSTSYMPVSDEPIAQEQKNLVESPKVLRGPETGLEQSNTYQMVYGFDFENSYDMRTELNDRLSITLSQGRQEFLDLVDGGTTPEEAAESMNYDGRAGLFYEQVRKVFGQ